jgi:hypothetical protein
VALHDELPCPALSDGGGIHGHGHPRGGIVRPAGEEINYVEGNWPTDVPALRGGRGGRPGYEQARTRSDGEADRATARAAARAARDEPARPRRRGRDVGAPQECPRDWPCPAVASSAPSALATSPQPAIRPPRETPDVVAGGHQGGQEPPTHVAGGAGQEDAAGRVRGAHGAYRRMYSRTRTLRAVFSELM